MKGATPSKVRKVYTAASLLGHTDVRYDKAQRIAARFTETELDRIVTHAARRNHVRNRLTVVSNPAKV